MDRLLGSVPVGQCMHLKLHLPVGSILITSGKLLFIFFTSIFFLEETKLYRLGESLDLYDTKSHSQSI